MLHGKGEILSHEKVCPDLLLLTLKLPEIARSASPGQFLHIRVGEMYDPLLRRPMSIARADMIMGEVEILYKVMGKGTYLLSTKGEGETVDCIGPLGRGFSVPEEGSFILVAGGRGVAPLLFLSERLLQRGNAQLTFLMGASTRSCLFYENGLVALGARVGLATDDGSGGYRGPVTHLLEDELSRITDQGDTTVLSCGPEAMLKEVSRICVPRKIPCQISLESLMACGVGACQSCVAEVYRDPKKPELGTFYKRVCVEGPVFNAEEVVFR